MVDAAACQEHLAIERLDPLYIDPLTLDGVQFFLNEYSWYREAPADWAEEPFGLELAPDSYHKYDISGGAPYAMAVPAASIDGLLLNEWHDTTFVDYLRTCLRFGGLPGLELVQRNEEVVEVLAYLRQDLLPI